MSQAAQCPICGAGLEGDEASMNAHIDECLTRQYLAESSSPSPSSATSTGQPSPPPAPAPPSFGTRQGGGRQGTNNEEDDEALALRFFEEARKAEEERMALDAQLALQLATGSDGSGGMGMGMGGMMGMGMGMMGMMGMEGGGVREARVEVTCPYVGCSQRMSALELPGHVEGSHASCAQALPCPICLAETGQAYAVNEHTNLLRHLRSAHAGRVGSDAAELERALVESRTSFMLPRRVELPTEVGKNYSVQTLPKALGKECEICFEEFEKGNSVAWMDCLCVFHEKCLEEWFTKCEKKSCPVHRDDKD